MIAEKADNPALADNLMKANKGYSRYARIWPDIRRAASKEAVGAKGIFRQGIIQSGLRSLEGPISRAAVRVGGLPRKLANLAVE